MKYTQTQWDDIAFGFSVGRCRTPDCPIEHRWWFWLRFGLLQHTFLFDATKREMRKAWKIRGKTKRDFPLGGDFDDEHAK